MLVLTRKLGEQIMVPDCELTVTVLAVDGKSVRLGFSAPDSVAIYREEIWAKVSVQRPNAPLKG